MKVTLVTDNDLATVEGIDTSISIFSNVYKLSNVVQIEGTFTFDLDLNMLNIDPYYVLKCFQKDTSTLWEYKGLQKMEISKCGK